MKHHQYARRLAAFAASLPGFRIERTTSPTYNHMGAVLSDSVLQSGLNYRTVVEPRVVHILTQHPEASTTPVFLELLERYGAKQVLQWRHDEKPRRLCDLTAFFVNHEVYTERTLRHWLSDPANCTRLREVKGVGEKTVDYMKKLVGLESVAVDRHIRRFIRDAGLPCDDYAEIQAVVERAAMLLGTTCSGLDRAMWHYATRR